MDDVIRCDFCLISQFLGDAPLHWHVFRPSSSRCFHDLHPELGARFLANYLYRLYLVVSRRPEIAYLRALQSRVWWLAVLNDWIRVKTYEFNDADGVICERRYMNSHLIGWRLEAGASSRGLWATINSHDRLLSMIRERCRWHILTPGASSRGFGAKSARDIFNRDRQRAHILWKFHSEITDYIGAWSFPLYIYIY